MKGWGIRGGYQRELEGAHGDVHLGLGSGRRRDHSGFTFFGAATELAPFPE